VELKLGHKRTEVGVIPVDWHVTPLASVADKIMVGIASAATHAYRSKGIPMFRNQNIKPGRLDDDDLLFIAPEYEAAYRNKRLRAGDLLTMRTGYPGVTALVPEEYEQAQSFTTLITRPNKSSIEPLYLCYYINSELGKKFFIQSQIGGAQKNVNAGTLRGMPLGLPSTLIEQTAIATALCDVDALLSGLDKLIAKKRDLKQAAMQQLLTGKTRLPGFDGEWVTQKLRDVATLKARIGWQGLTTSEYLDTGDYYLVTGTDFANGRIAWEDCHYVTQSRYNQDQYIQIRLRDVLVTKDGTIGKVALVDELDRPATLNSGVFVIRPKKDGFEPEFFYFLLMSRIFDEFLSQLSAGSTINHLYQKDFVGFTYALPPTKEEQIAIAKVLSDMDTELTALETRREKTRLLKQAMMQELLTGKTRLV